MKIVARTQNPTLSRQNESTQMLHGEISWSNVHAVEWHSAQMEIWAALLQSAIRCRQFDNWM